MANVQTPDLAVQAASLSLRDEESYQVDYDQVAFKAPVYYYDQVQQTGGGGSSLTLSANAQTQSLFNFPDKPYNLAQSYYTLDVSFAGEATGGHGDTLFTDCKPIYSMKFKPANGGDALVDMTDVQIASKVICPLAMPMEVYRSRQGVYGDTVLGNTLPLSQLHGCQPFSTLISTQRTNVALVASVPSDPYITDASGISARPSQTDHQSGITLDEISPQRLISGAFTGNAATGAIQVRYKIVLGEFSGTIFALDKTICFGQIMQHYINWQPVANWGFHSTNLGAASGTLAVPTVTNMYLYLAVDHSDSGKEISALAHTSGLTMNIPYTITTSFTPAAAGSQDVPVILTPGTGNMLKRIITIVSNNTNTGISTANIENVAGVKWTGVRSYLDGSALYDYQLSLADGTLYNFMRPFLEGSSMGLGQRNYEINCFYMDNFSDCHSGAELNYNDFKASGLPINKQRNYSARFAITANRIVYILQVWLRQLIIKPSGLAWGNGQVMVV